MGNQHGWIGIDVSWNNCKGVDEVEVCGYPGDKHKKSKYTEWTMWKDSGKYEIKDPFLTYKISTSAGNSGSPLLKTKNGKTYAIGVHMRGEKKEENFAIRLTYSTINKINEWVGEITGKLDLSKLVFI